MSDVGFPYNVVDELKASYEGAVGVATVITRPLRQTDANGAVGVFALDWVPTDHNIGQHDPSLSTYFYNVQSLVKHSDEQEGKRQHAQLSKMLRLMLYRDEDLRVRLGQQSETLFGSTERVGRWGVRAHRFVSNEIKGQFLFLATLDVWVETDTV